MSVFKLKNKQDKQKKVSLSVSKQEQNSPASSSNENDPQVIVCLDLDTIVICDRDPLNLDKIVTWDGDPVALRDRICLLTTLLKSCNVSHEEAQPYDYYLCDSDLSQLTKEFISTSEHSSNLNKDEARTYHDSNMELMTGTA